MVEVNLKIPLLNNIALCLYEQDFIARAIQMLDQVLEVDSRNAKALSRKVKYLLQQGQIDEAN